ncbi:MAG: MFS transporter [Pseudomonadota bacterium]|nr:MFS transporter [Pseudomonadota bacterium]
MFADAATSQIRSRARIAWCLYDWGNSAFPTVIVTFIFSTYFVTAVASDEVTGTKQWSWALSLSGLVIATLSPVCGAIADSTGRCKSWLALCSTLAIVATGLLWFVHPTTDSVFWALVVFALANVGFEMGQVFYNALLPTIVSPRRFGRLSGWGWALGYAGGLCCLSIALLVFVEGSPPPFGLDKDLAEHVRVVGPMVALWFAVFCLPLFLLVSDVGRVDLSMSNALRSGVSSLIATLRRLRDYRQIGWYLLARVFYVDGMNTMFAFGGIYAAGTFGMTLAEVIGFGIAMNVSAGLGAATFAWVDDSIGPRRTVVIALSGLIGLGVPLLVIESKVWFWIIGVSLGVFMGPAQAASRSLMAHLAPVELRTEMFGLFAFSGKATCFMGPLILGAVTLATGSQRMGMTTVVILLAVGLAILFCKVREPS